MNCGKELFDLGSVSGIETCVFAYFVVGSFTLNSLSVTGDH